MQNNGGNRYSEPKIKEFLVDYLKGLFQTLGEDATVRISKEVDTLFVSVDMEDPAIYIGKSGEVLSSMQYLINMVLQHMQCNNIRITLDIGGYKRRQIEILRNIANNAALQVRRYGRPVELQPMSAFARRIIHTTLKENPMVFTHSQGEEPRRFVVVDLKK